MTKYLFSNNIDVVLFLNAQKAHILSLFLNVFNNFNTIGILK